MMLIARDIIIMCWGAGLDSLSKLVTHDSFDMQVTSRWETFTLGREGTALASGSFIILAVVLIYFMYKVC